MKRLSQILMWSLGVSVLLILGCATWADNLNKKAPDFTVTTLDNKQVTLSKLKGLVVLLGFTTTWCPYCRVAAPKIQEIHQRFNKRKFVALAVYEDSKGASIVKPFVQDHQLTYTIALDPEGQGERKYRVRGYPTFYLIDQEGYVRQQYLGFGEGTAEAMTKDIENLLTPTAK